MEKYDPEYLSSVQHSKTLIVIPLGVKRAFGQMAFVQLQVFRVTEALTAVDRQQCPSQRILPRRFDPQILNLNRSGQ